MYDIKISKRLFYTYLENYFTKSLVCQIRDLKTTICVSCMPFSEESLYVISVNLLVEFRCCIDSGLYTNYTC